MWGFLVFLGDDPRYDVASEKVSMSPTKAQNDENAKTFVNGEASSSSENIVDKSTENNNVEKKSKSPVAPPPTSRFAVEPTVETSLSTESDKTSNVKRKTSKTEDEHVVAVAVEATENQN